MKTRRFSTTDTNSVFYSIVSFTNAIEFQEISLMWFWINFIFRINENCYRFLRRRWPIFGFLSLKIKIDRILFW